MSGAYVCLLCALIAPGAATAQSSDNCEVQITPSTKEGDVFVVEKDTKVTVHATDADGTKQPVDLYYLGLRARLTDAVGDGSTTITVDDFALWGVGLYEVAWGSNCVARIKVNAPFSDAIAADAATVVFVLSLIALVLTLTWRVKITNPNAPWVARLIFKGKLERDEETGEVHAKFSYTVSQTLLGTLWGLLLGGATFTMLQQAALTPPTIEVALEVTLPLIVIGTLAGLRRGTPRATPPRHAATPLPRA